MLADTRSGRDYDCLDRPSSVDLQGHGEMARVSEFHGLEMTSHFELLELQRTLYTSRNSTRRWLHNTRRDWINATLNRLAFKARGRALEVGFGSGIYLPILATLYSEAIGSDVDEVFVRHAGALAKGYPNLHVIVDDITHTNLPEKSFDLILCTEVIEHIADSQSAFSAIHRLLRRGGFLVLSTPQRWSPLEVLAKLAFLPGVIDLVRRVYKERIYETGHINLMTEAQVSNQLREAGFRIREHFKSGMYLPFVAEFAGQYGLSLEQRLESRLRDGPLDWLLWTQYYVAEA